MLHTELVSTIEFWLPESILAMWARPHRTIETACYISRPRTRILVMRILRSSNRLIGDAGNEESLHTCCLLDLKTLDARQHKFIMHVTCLANGRLLGLTTIRSLVCFIDLLFMHST